MNHQMNTVFLACQKVFGLSEYKTADPYILNLQIHLLHCSLNPNNHLELFCYSPCSFPYFFKIFLKSIPVSFFKFWRKYYMILIKRADALASAPNCISIYYLLFISAIAACAAASLAIGTLNGEHDT